MKTTSQIDNCLFSRVTAHLRFTQILLGSISGVVSMNTTCIVKMALEGIHLGRPLCHGCKNF